MSHGAAGDRPRLRNLEALRVAAALGVLGFHWVHAPANRMGPGPLTLGWFGVDVFFVLSGFVVWRGAILDAPRSARSAATFVAVRFARIFTAYWFWLAVVVVLRPFDARRPEIDWPGSIFLWQLSFRRHVLPAAWTLGYELLGYLGIGVLSLLGRRRAIRAAALGLAGIALASAISWFVAGWSVVPVDAFRGSLVLAGGLLAEVLQPKRTAWWAPLGFVVAAALLSATFPWPRGVSDQAFLVCPAALLVVAAAVSLEYRGQVVPRLVARFGAATLTIYLAQPLLLYSPHDLDLLPLRLGPGTPRVTELALLAAIGLAYGVVHERWVERPVFQTARRFIERRWLGGEPP